MRMYPAIALVAALAVAGCVACPPKDQTFQEENALATAGFNLKMADTPAKLERITKLPQRRLVQGEAQGRQIYVWRMPRAASAGIPAVRMPIGD